MKRLFWSLFSAFRSHIYTRVFACYAVILAVLAAACGYSYLSVSSLSRENVLTQNRLALENASTNVNNALNMIDFFQSTLYSTEDLQKLMCADKTSNDFVYGVYKLIHSLPTLYDTSGLLEGYCIYLNGSEYALAPGQGYNSLERYYKDHFAISATQSFDDWKDTVLHGMNRSYHSSYSDGSCIQYIIHLPSRIPIAAGGVVIYRINSVQLLRMVSAAFSGGAECAFVTDKNGTVLAASDIRYATVFDTEESLSALKRSHIITECAVGSTGLRLITIVSDNVVSEQAGEAVHTLLWILIWMLIAGCLLIVIAAIANLRPLMHISDRITEVSTQSRGMWKIPEAFSKMDARSRTLENELSVQQSHLKQACVNRLIHGSGIDAYSLEEMLQSAKFSISGVRFFGVIVTADGNADGSYAQISLAELLSRFENTLTLLSFESMQTVYCLYAEDEDGTASLQSVFTEIYESLKSSYNIEAKFYIGIPVFQLEKTADSFSSAEWLRSTSSADTWLNIVSDESHEVNVRLMLPENEQRLLETHVLSGDSDKANELLESIFARCFSENNLRSFDRQYIYCRLTELLSACAVGLGLNRKLPDRLLQMPQPEFCAWLTEELTACCAAARERSAQKSRLLNESVIEYIEEHYSDYELTLYSLANHLGITSPYLSGMFKRQFGTNFSVYLEQVRIRHAEEILNNTDASIDEIAAKTGYGNADSFRRAFRRVKGVTPSQYRSNTV